MTDRESGEPLSRVVVTLVSNTFLQDRKPGTAQIRLEPHTTLTGADGRYEYKHVPAGAYVVIFDPAMRGTHLRQYFGEVQIADDADGSRPPPVTLADGEVRDDVNGSLSRSLAIEGRVLDDLGEPMAYVSMTVQAAEGVATRWWEARSTDDRGTFRVFGLRPGEYRVCANPEARFELPEHVRVRPIRTCYPSAIAVANAEPIVLTSADVTGIDIRVQRTQAFKVSGMVIDSTGAPVERSSINFVPLAKDSSSSSRIRTVMKEGSQFVATGVTSGSYAVGVHIGAPYDPDDKREWEFGYAQFDVDTADVEGIVVTTSRLPKVAGRVVFEDGEPPRGSEAMRVFSGPTTPVLRRMGIGHYPGAEVQSDSTFVLTAVPGPQFITLENQPSGWIVGAVTYKDEDVTDTAVQLKASSDSSALQITMTRRGAVVSGRVLDSAGKTVSAAYALLISSDPLKRQSSLGIVKSAITKSDGTFTLGPVRAGEYVIAAGAVESPTSVSFPDGDDLEPIAQSGQRVTLAEGEKRHLDVRLAKLR